VEAQATGPILNPIEMAAPSPAHVVRTLKSMPDYVERFAAAFPEQEDAVTFVNAGVAIAAFERGLVTPSRWDDYLNGNKEALTPAEVDGLKVFTNVGCMVCHTGELLGGSMFQKVGVVEPWPNQGDMGRFGVTHAKGDKMVFKVPTLRNAARTAPYFHDGSGATTDQAVTMMGRHQLGLELTPSEVGAIVAWLGALTGTVDQRYIAPPDLPPSSETTPAPDAG
jgi:cytochrome c peroxidase